MFKINWNFFRSIKTRVRIFFFLNIGLVIGNYAITVVNNQNAEEDRKYVQVSKENEKYIEEIEYLTKSVVEGRESDLKKELKMAAEKYATNLEALETGKVKSTVNHDKDYIEIKNPPKIGNEEFKVLKTTWKDLKEKLDIIIESEIEVDSITTQEIEPETPPLLQKDSTQSDSLQTDSLATVEDTLKKATSFIDTLDRDAVEFQIVLNPEVASNYERAKDLTDDILFRNRVLSDIYEKNYTNSQSTLRDVLMSTFLLNLAVLILGTFVIGTYLINPLKRITATAEDVASGDVNTQVTYNRKDEIGEVAESLNLIVGSFKQYTEFAENIGKGNFDTNFEVKGEKDTLGFTLLKMRDSLKNVAEEDRKRNWANEGFALFSEILRATDKDIDELSYHIISDLVKYLNATQGGVFLLTSENGEQFLEMKASIAYNKRKYDDRRIQLGQGLLGQVVLEKDMIYLDKIPQEYIQITSGLGSAVPKAILMVPLVVNREVYGAMEIASFKPFEKYEIDFVERLAENIASTVASVKISENTKRLLDETRQYAEQMQAQEEEMRQNMEELATTQDEMERNQRKLEDYKVNLEKEVEKRTNLLKDKEEELSNALFQLQSIMESAKSGIVAINTNYEVVAANQQIKDILKQTRQAIFDVGSNWLSIFDREDDRINTKKIWDKALSGQSYNLEERFELTLEGVKWYDVSVSPILSENEEVIGASMFVRDITARKQSQKNIELNAHILDNSASEVYIFDAQTLKFLKVNEQARKNLGYTLDELKELTTYQIETKFDRQSFVAYIEPLRQGEVENLAIETTYQRKDGSKYEVELSLQYFEDGDGDMPVFAAIAQDITERKQQENQLREALERFYLTTAATKEGVWEMVINPNDPLNPDNPVWWSKRFVMLLGFDEVEDFGEILYHWIASLHPDDKDNTLKAFLDHILDKTGRTEFEVEYRLLNKKSEFAWFSATGQTLRQEDGTPVKFVGSIRDITKRKETEQQLEEQTAIINGILNAAVNSIISIDTHYMIKTANESTEKTFGYQASEIQNMPVGILFAEVFNFEDALNQITQVKVRRKNGTIFPAEVSLSLTQVNEQKIYVAIFRDITERQQAEQEQQRLIEVLDKLPDFVTYTNLQGTIKYINKSGVNMLGYDSELEIINQSIYHFYWEDTRQKLEGEWIPTAKAHGIWQGESFIKLRNGNTLKVHQTIVPHFGKTGNLEYISHIMSRVNEAKA
jgi:PAS domain S-box-containing protein